MLNTKQEQSKITTCKNWTYEKAKEIFSLPFMDLVLQAQSVLRENFPANKVQLSTLLSIKTGACPEDCKYCSQSGHYKTNIEKEKLLSAETVLLQAKKAKAEGASRFCMGAAWRTPPKKAIPELVEMIKSVKAMGLETCLTAGMLGKEQADELKLAGLDYYNHNLDTSKEFYETVVTTRSYQDRLDTLEVLRQANIKTCCGGILGLGEQEDDRLNLLVTLANLPEQPESVPINLLVPISGTPLEKQKPVDPIDFVKTVATARIMLPKSMVRLSAGRNTMSKELQSLCFLAGANSIHFGAKLLTTPLPGENEDMALLNQLGIEPLIKSTNDEHETCSLDSDTVCNL